LNSPNATMNIVNYFLRAIIIGLCWGSTGSVYADSTDWLMKINNAAAKISFSGTFVYVHDGKVDAMEVTRRIKDGMMEERLYSLNGSAREVIRGMNKVWCYIPDENVVVNDQRQMVESGFPRILPGDYEQLKVHYTFAEGETDRIADRLAHQLKVVPNDSYRYGYSLWADMETGLLLRSDLIDMENQIVEQYMFVDIDIGGEISDAQLAPVSANDDLQLFANNSPIATPAESSDWELTQIPNGYQLSNHIKRMSPMDASEVEHLVYTDGLSTVSVFIKEAREGQSHMSGISRMGAVHAFRVTVNNFRITVMGEVPAVTVKYLAQGVVYNK